MCYTTSLYPEMVIKVCLVNSGSARPSLFILGSEFMSSLRETSLGDVRGNRDRGGCLISFGIYLLNVTITDPAVHRAKYVDNMILTLQSLSAE